MPTKQLDPEAEIARIIDATGLSREEASLHFVNSLPGPKITHADIEAHRHAAALEELAPPVSDDDIPFSFRTGFDDAAPAPSDGAKPEEKPARHPLRWKKLSIATPAPRTWFIDHWLTTGATLIAGTGGTGKSLLAQTLATALATGKPYLEQIAAPRKVLLWSCEDEHDEIWRRQLDICRYFGTPIGDLPSDYVIEPRLGRVNSLTFTDYGALKWTLLHEELRAQVNDYKADVLVLDNIAQVYGGKENDRHHVTEFVNGLLGISDRPLAILLVGHPGRAVGSEYSGSSAWENAVRMRWYLGANLPDQQPQPGQQEEPDDPSVRYLAKRKANYTAQDYRKLVWKDGLYAPEERQLPRFDERYGGRRDRAEALLLRLVQHFNDKGVHVSFGHTSPNWMPRVILDGQLEEGFTRQELSRAMGALRARAEIVEGEVGRYPNRHPKIGITLPKKANGATGAGQHP